MAPGSSGFGNATVGKSGSGWAWAPTTAGDGRPARAKAPRRISSPTPCMGVYATRRSTGTSEVRSPATPSRYAETTSSPRSEMRSSSREARGRSATRSIEPMWSAISRSQGATIWAPSPAYTL